MEKMIRILDNNKIGKTMFVNMRNGSTIRFPLEVKDIVIDMLEKNGFDEKNYEFEDDSDREYVMDIHKELLEQGFFVNDSINFQNKIVSIQLTNGCNLRCKHCCVSSGDELLNELSTDELIDAIGKIIKFNPKHINISGGEPMIHKDFEKISKYLYDNYRGRKILSTNATLIDKDNVHIISRYYDQVDISVDGVDEETCSKIRGKRVFEKTINSIKLLKSIGFDNINISMVLFKGNEHLEDDFKSLAESLGVDSMCRLFSPVVRGKENSDYFIGDIRKETYIPESFINKNEGIGVSSCSAGRKELFITADGDIYPCPSFYEKDFIMGNIKDIDDISSSIVDITDKDSICNLIKKIDMKQSEECSSCEVFYFCWTCPGYVNEFYDRVDALRKRCDVMKEILYRRVWFG